MPVTARCSSRPSSTNDGALSSCTTYGVTAIGFYHTGHGLLSTKRIGDKVAPQTPSGIYFDGYLLTAIGALFTFVLIPSVGWLFSQLWNDRNEAYKENVLLLKAQFADADVRKTLWTSLGDIVKDQTREIAGLKQSSAELKQAWADFLSEYRRKNQ